jgi:putative ABC transport system permease protein
MTADGWFARLRRALSPSRPDREHQEEVAFHLDMAAQRLEATGLSPVEARRRARATFGGVSRVREETRDARGGRWLTDLARDARYALRQLRRTPGFTAVALLTLALGIGANTALFSVIDGVLLRPVPFHDPSELLVVWETDRTSGTIREPAAWPDYIDLTREARSLRAMAALTGLEMSYTPTRDAPQRLSTMGVTHTYFPLVGIGALLGRTFRAEDDVPGGPAVVVLGERFWRARFNADPAVIGQTILLDDVQREVIGIVPEGSDFGLDQLHARADYHAPYSGVGDVAAWLPLQASEQAYPRDTHPFFLLARLAEGSSQGRASDELTAIAARLEATHRSNTARGVHVEALTDVVFAPVRPVLYLLLGAVALVLLVACVNVANLLLARGAARMREVAVRGALGASVGRLARQFVAESLLLSLAGAALGVALAWGALRLLGSLAPADLPRAETIGLNGPVLVATLGVSLAVALAFGLVPTLQAMRVDVNETLKGESRGSSPGRRQGRLREWLVMAELALSVMLVLCAGLLIRSVSLVLAVDPGFDPRGVTKAEFTLPESRYPRDFRRYPDWPATQRFASAILQRVGALPGVEAVALASAHPLDAGFTNSFVVVGREAEARDWPEISVRQVSPGYFATLGTALRRGRLLAEGDDAAAPMVAVINATAAERYFGDRDPLGQEIRFWGISRRIVGVVGDERFRGPASPPSPSLYSPLAQAPATSGALLVRSTRDPAEVSGEVRRIFAEVDPQLAVYGIEALERTLLDTVGTRRFAMLVLGAFAALTLLLALIGVHGVLSYATAQRTREIGIRLALGATRGTAAREVIRGGLQLAAAGTLVGLVAAAGASRFVSGLLFGVTRSDPLTYLVVAVLVLGAAVIATVLPALRAARVVPTEALRME